MVDRNTFFFLTPVVKLKPPSKAVPCSRLPLYSRSEFLMSYSAMWKIVSTAGEKIVSVWAVTVHPQGR